MMQLVLSLTHPVYPLQSSILSTGRCLPSELNSAHCSHSGNLPLLHRFSSYRHFVFPFLSICPVKSWFACIIQPFHQAAIAVGKQLSQRGAFGFATIQVRSVKNIPQFSHKYHIHVVVPIHLISLFLGLTPMAMSACGAST